MRLKNGKFIVLEGIDGSGKSIQSDFLVRRLRRENYRVFKIDFPRYGAKSAGLVEEYLNGTYGSPSEVGPYRASVFYACDRYAAASRIEKKIADGFIIVADRYLASNIGHQGGKIIENSKWEKFVRWLYKLEYGLFQIPKPDITVILKTSPRVSYQMTSRVTDERKKAKKNLYLGKKKRDVHERSMLHLEQALRSYLALADLYPREYAVVECMRDGEFLPRNIIHERIWKAAHSIL